VTAGLVKEAGYDAVGITLQLYDHGEAMHRKGACCAGQDIHDARNVADAWACRIMCSTMKAAFVSR
jgi:tRNA-specific 2-thiouridylase